MEHMEMSKKVNKIFLIYYVYKYAVESRNNYYIQICARKCKIY